MSEIIDVLNEIDSQIQAISVPAHSLQERLEGTDKVLSDIGLAGKYIDEGVEGLKILSKASLPLSEVPVVGPVITVLSDGIKVVSTSMSAVKEVADGIKKPVQEIRKGISLAKEGLSKLNSAGNEIRLYLPKIIKGVAVIEYILKIIDCLVPLAEGCGLGESLGKVKKKLEDAASGSLGAAKRLLDICNGGGSAIQAAERLCHDITDEADAVATALSPLREVGKIIEPISSAIQKVINAIAPLRWLLDAISWLVDKILKPAIDAILSATGLKNLVDGLVRNLLEKLHISDVIGKISNVIKGSALVKELENVVSCPESLMPCYKELKDKLDSFSPVSADALRKELEGLFSEAVGVSMDSKEPVDIPDWPDDVLSPKPVLVSLPYSCQGICFQAYPVHETDDELPVTQPFHEDDIQNPLAKKIYAESSCVAELLSDFYRERVAIENDRDALGHNIRVLETFPEEIHSVVGCMEFLLKSAGFILSVAKLKDETVSVLKEISAVIQAQIDDCRAMEVQVAGIIQKMRTLLGSAESVIGFMPSKQETDRYIAMLHTYAFSADRLLDSFGIYDTKEFGEETRNKVQAVEEKVMGNIQSLLDGLAKLACDLQSSAGICQTFDAGVESFNRAFSGICIEGYLFPVEGLRRLYSVASVLSQIEGVYEPLQLLIEALREKTQAANGGERQPTNVLLQCTEQFSAGADAELCAVCGGFGPLTAIRDRLEEFGRKEFSFGEKDLPLLKGIAATIPAFFNDGFPDAGESGISINKFIEQKDMETIAAISRENFS